MSVNSRMACLLVVVLCTAALALPEDPVTMITGARAARLVGPRPTGGARALDIRADKPGFGAAGTVPGLWDRGGLFGRWRPQDEIVALRAENAKTFDNHDGTRTRVICGPLHRRDADGCWVDLPEREIVARYEEQHARHQTWPKKGATDDGWSPAAWFVYYNYYETQSIYLSSEVSFSGSITWVGFLADGGGYADTLDLCRTWLHDTSISRFTGNNWSTPPTGTMVLPAAGYATLTIPNLGPGPYVCSLQVNPHHDASRNLMYSFRNWGTYENYYNLYYTHTQSEYRSKWAYSDNGMPTNLTRCYERPDIYITFIPDSTPVDVAVVGCGTYSYPLVVGTTDTVYCRVTNNGTTAASGVQVNGYINGSSIGTQTVTLGARGVDTALVRFAFTTPAFDASLLDFGFGAHHPSDTSHYNDSARFDDWSFPAETYKAQGFDYITSFPPSGWVRVNADGGTQQWGQSYSVPEGGEHSGRYFAVSVSEGTSLRNDDWLVTDAITPAEWYADTLGFFYRAWSSSLAESLEVWVMRSQSPAGAVDCIYGSRSAVTNWTQIKRSLDAYDGQTIYIGFRNRGLAEMALALDDVWFQRHFVVVHDVDATVIDSPTGTVDSGATVPVRAHVANRGNQSEAFSVRFRIAGAGYDQTVNNVMVAPGDTVTVDFPDWTVTTGPGTFAMRCSTQLAGDMNPGNDTADGSVNVHTLHDVDATVINSPTGIVDSNTTVPVQAQVMNRGNQSETFSVRFYISGAGYDQTVNNVNVASGGTVTVDFPDWTVAAGRGTFAMRCSTRLVGDMYPGNDTANGSVAVRIHDVDVTTISSPSAPVDSGETVPVRAQVLNRGSVQETFSVRFYVGGAGYDHTVNNVTAGSGSSVYVNFPNWTADVRGGNYAMRCSTRLAGDMNPGNDTADRTVHIAVRDIGVFAIIAPADSTVDGSTVTPEVAIANYGTEALLTDVHLAILDSAGTVIYDETQSNVEIPAGGLDSLAFLSQWTASPFGEYTVEATTLVDDMHPENNAIIQPFTVVPSGTFDATVAAIIAPVGDIDTGTAIAPSALVANAGTLTATFDVAFYIVREDGQVYEDVKAVTALPPGASARVDFAEWPGPHAAGSYATRCTTRLGRDANLDNDCAVGAFTVTARAHWLPGWHEVAHLPEGAPAKPVKDGGWVAYHAGNGLIYAAKGNKQLSFYAYDPLADTWTTKASQPGGASRRLPYKGGHGCSDGTSSIYVTRGNSTFEFYRYDVAGDSWTTLENVPEGSNKVKGGTDMAYVEYQDSGYVYLLKGYKNEFYRYSTVSGHWQTLAPAPATVSMKYDKGSFLTSDNSGRIYVHQSKYNKLYAYDLATAAWSTELLAGMPLVSHITGRTKKSKDGGTAAWSNGSIYALKGGNTQEYYRYYPLGDTWHELDTLPQYTAYTGKKKKVKAGADMSSYADGIVFALKGNKTYEFWRWVEPTRALGAHPTRDGAAASGRMAIGNCRVSIAPNPLSGSRMLHVVTTGPLGRSTTIVIYDALGRLVLTRPLGRLTDAHVDVRSLSAGVYLVKLTTADGSLASLKLVVER